MTPPIEFKNRADMFERELLARYTAASLTAINSRQIEAFRVGSGIHASDSSWQLLLDKWRKAGLTEMAVSELETWNDENLHNLMIRQEAPPTTREDAALELYRRASKFVRTPEFATFLTRCIDRELVERKAGHEPTRVLDALQRLNDKTEASRIALAGVDAAHTESEKVLLDALGRAMETLRAEADAQGQSLHLAIAAVRRTVKRHAIFFGSAIFITSVALVLHLLHAF